MLTGAATSTITAVGESWHSDPIIECFSFLKYLTFVSLVNADDCLVIWMVNFIVWIDPELIILARYFC